MSAFVVKDFLCWSIIIAAIESQSGSVYISNQLKTVDESGNTCYTWFGRKVHSIRLADDKYDLLRQVRITKQGMRGVNL